ncbi:MAG: hypothetical protein WDN10_00320 [bacterium]
MTRQETSEAEHAQAKKARREFYLYSVLPCLAVFALSTLFAHVNLFGGRDLWGVLSVLSGALGLAWATFPLWFRAASGMSR